MRILLCGKAGAGKTTAAGFLEAVGFKNLEIGLTIKAIARILYYGSQRRENCILVTAALFGEKDSEKLPEEFFIKINNLATNLKKIDFSKKAELRPYLQEIGDILRSVDEDIFLKTVLKRVEETKLPVVISDGRFNREIEFLKNHGFKAYEIVTDDEIRFKRLKERDPGFEPKTLNHRTETDELNCPKIYNNDSLQELKQKILELRMRC